MGCTALDFGRPAPDCPIRVLERLRPSARSELSHIAAPVATVLTPPMIADTSVPKIRHGAFVAALGGVADADMASSPRWQALCAGFTTLRLVDAWATEGRVDARAFAATCATVATLPRTSTARGLLGAITSAVGSPRGPGGPSPYIPLLAYGRLLEYEADWALAVDAYGMIA